MSVVGSVNCYVTPIFRPPGYRIDNPLIGKWNGLASATGDGTGGTYNLVIVLNGIFNLSQWALFDICFTFMWDSGVTATSNILQYQLTEPTTIAAATWQPILSTEVYNGRLGEQIHQKMKWKVSNPALGSTSLSRILTPNTNGVAAYYATGGYIYDERYI